MDYNEVRNRIYEKARFPQEDEVLKVNIEGYRMLISRDNILINLGDEWVSLVRVLEVIARGVEKK